MHRGNPLRRFRCLPQRLTQFVHAGLQHTIAHCRLRPDGVEEGLFGHQLAGMRHQIDENLKGFRAQGHRLFGVPQTGIRQIEPKGSKVPVHRSSLPYHRPHYPGVRGWRLLTLI